MGRVHRKPTGPLPRARCTTCGELVPVSTCADGHQVFRKHRRRVRGRPDQTCDGSRRTALLDPGAVPRSVRS